MLATKKAEGGNKRKKKKDVEFINDIDDRIAKLIRSKGGILWTGGGGGGACCKIKLKKKI
jgi:hypothetical protein